MKKGKNSLSLTSNIVTSNSLEKYPKKIDPKTNIDSIKIFKKENGNSLFEFFEL